MVSSTQESTPFYSADGVSDEELVHYFQAGDRAVFDRLFRRHYHVLCGYILHLTDRDCAEDIAQHTSEIAFNKLASLKEGECFKGWLYRIAMNLIKDHWRHANVLRWLPWIAVEKEDSIAGIVRVEEFEQTIEQEDFIRRVMCKVPQKFRLCTYLDIFCDMRQHEIADLLHMRERTVRRYIAAGKEELRKSYTSLIDNQGALKGKDNQ